MEFRHLIRGLCIILFLAMAPHLTCRKAERPGIDAEGIGGGDPLGTALHNTRLRVVSAMQRLKNGERLDLLCSECRTHGNPTLCGLLDTLNKDRQKRDFLLS